jgi:hypothetical protein
MKLLQRFCLIAGLATALLAVSSFAQAPLQIGITNGNATVSWPGSESLNSLQTTTSLSPPVQWSGAGPVYYGFGSVNFPMTNSQQFFRLEQSWPVFAFDIFYNLNLEIDPGNLTPINGPVFCNQSIWAGSPYVSFVSTVAAAGNIDYLATNGISTDPWCSGKTDSGTPIANFSYPPAVRQLSLNLPIVNGSSAASAEAMINLVTNGMGAPNPSAYTTNGQFFLFNECDLIISNSATGLAGARGSNITIWFQDIAQASPLTPITKDFYALKTGGSTNILNNYSGIDSPTNVLSASYSFVTNVQFYDYREFDTVQAVQIDVSKLNVWLTNAAETGGQQYNQMSYMDKGRGICSVFIYNNVPLTVSQLPAVRLVNGQQLPCTTDPSGSGPTTDGLTVVTPQPLYIKGNYNVQTASSSAGASAGTTNTAYTYPASLMGDAITILAGSWSDGYTSSTSLSSRTPTTTTINAAVLEGIVQSANSNYSGGVENFLRLEENWSNVTLQYNGSIVVMFASQYATNFWPGTGTIYNAPTRKWAFDLNFTDPAKLPPLTPFVVNYVSP